mmetsp:Transcript_28766/g.81004  ORF Transcript_28766/g.81004 Transcript_28766/m.81004 type:complete len:544 (+) Transcript_28766:1009-2640(+)
MGLQSSAAPSPAVLVDDVARVPGEPASSCSTLRDAYLQVKCAVLPGHGKLCDVLPEAVSRKRASAEFESSHGDPVKKAKASPEGGQACNNEEELNNRMPSSYKTLVSIYDSLLLSQALLLSRHERCTFDRLRQAAERTCGRQIKLSHLQQIKTVYPEAVEWSWVRSNGLPAGSSGRGRFTLKLVLGPATEALSSSLPKSSMMKRHRPAMQSRAMQASVDTLSARLLERAEAQACPESDGDSPRVEGPCSIKLAPLPVHPDDKGSRNFSSRWRGAKSTSGSILCSETSVSEVLCEDDSCGQVRRASHNRRVTFGPVSVRKIPSRSPLRFSVKDSDDSSIDTEDMAEEDVACRGLTGHHSDPPPDGLGLETLAYVSNCCVDLLNDDSTGPRLDVSSLPEVLRTPNSDGELPLSMETLEMLGEWERQDKARDSDAELQKAASAKAVSALPRTFDMLQMLFGSLGPCAMTLEKVVDRLETSCNARNPVSKAEVHEMLHALASAAPSYLRLLKPGETSSRSAMVRINRKQDWLSLRKELTALASKAQA